MIEEQKQKQSMGWHTHNASVQQNKTTDINNIQEEFPFLTAFSSLPQISTATDLLSCTSHH